jgi:hypothetical protein
LGTPGKDPFFGFGRIDVFSALQMSCYAFAVGGRILEPEWRVLLMLPAEAALGVIAFGSTAMLLRHACSGKTRRKNDEAAEGQEGR